MFVILCCLLLLNNVLGVDRFGPYKCTLVRVDPCSKPTKPVAKDVMLFQAEIYNTTKKNNILGGNLTIVKDVRCKRINIKSYYWEFGRWNAQYMMNNMGCNSAFLPIAAKATGVKIDKDTCKFLKGSYSIQNLDVNAMQHAWLLTQEYGRLMWVAEFFSLTGSMFCWEFETVATPA